MTSSALILLSVAYFLAETNSVENIYSDNDWRPMSNEKVFELQRNFIKTPLEVQIKNVPEILMDNAFQGNVIKIVQTNHFKESIKAHEAISPLGGENESKGRASEGSYLNTVQDQTIINANHIRKAKEITGQMFNLFSNNNNNDEKKPKEETFGRNINSKNTYEVKENVDEDLLHVEHDLNPRNVGYKYQNPIETRSTNLTSDLFDILANHNIRTSDNLPNYALSLRQNSQNSNNKEFIYMHVPVKVPLRYNSPNHFPIDPLLAVFLSNYGYYLPGLYGYNRSFNNLYGYLASNNIHNNKPFGSYKIYSDLD